MQDRLSSRYSPSGGYIDRGRPGAGGPARAVRGDRPAGSRHRRAGARQRARVFACQTLEPLRVQRGDGVCLLLQAPDPVAILNARPIAAADLPPDQRRFPAQLDWIAPRLAEVPESQVPWVTDFSDAASALHCAELPLIQRLQRWLGRMRLAWAAICWARPFQLALLPLLLPLLGWSRLRHLLFAMVLLTLVVNLPWRASAGPGPSTCNPSWSRQSAQGFGMPSGHAASTLLSLGPAVWLVAGAAGMAGALLALLLAGGGGLARVWLGVHFPRMRWRPCSGALLLALRARWRSWRHACPLGRGAHRQRPSAWLTQSTAPAGL